MNESDIQLTVFFEDPFWVGVFERTISGRLSVSKVTFGAEPKDYEVWEHVLKHFRQLSFSPAVEAQARKTVSNPKRLQREIRRQSAQTMGIGTRSQQALQLQREERKMERRAFGREQRDAEKQRQFGLKQQKRKEKHRGR